MGGIDGWILLLNPLNTKLSCWNFNLVKLTNSLANNSSVLCATGLKFASFFASEAAIAHTVDQDAPPTSEVKPIKCSGQILS